MQRCNLTGQFSEYGSGGSLPNRSGGNDRPDGAYPSAARHSSGCSNRRRRLWGLIVGDLCEPVLHPNRQFRLSAFGGRVDIARQPNAVADSHLRYPSRIGVTRSPNPGSAQGIARASGGRCQTRIAIDAQRHRTLPRSVAGRRVKALEAPPKTDLLDRLGRPPQVLKMPLGQSGISGRSGT
jgi:hypothetical protein